MLTLLAGPGFSLLFMSGFALAPLAHGAVIAPACQMLSGLILSAWLAHQRWTRESAVGAGGVVLGLACIGGDALLGDGLFVLAGVSWGLFGALSRRWQVDQLRVTAVVVVLSLALFGPAYLLWADPRGMLQAGRGAIALQVLAHSRAAALLGSGRAGFFGAIVPAAATLIAIPVLGEVPGPLQWAGIAAVVAGLGVAFGATRVLLVR